MNKQSIVVGIAIGGALLLSVLVPTGASAACKSGGLTPAKIDACTPAPKAKLLPNGELIPPSGAPPRVKAVIEAANRIRTKPYIWGGGHARWWDRGYDCSGSVSFALHGGEFLASPLPSGALMRWGRRGKGRWISVYANGGHTYAVIAGYRWDTSGDRVGTGPRWHADMRSRRGFVVRHPAGY